MRTSRITAFLEFILKPISENFCKNSPHEFFQNSRQYTRDLLNWKQGRNEVRWPPGTRSKFGARSFGSKCTVLKKVLVTWLGLFAAPAIIWRPTVIRRPVNYALLSPPSLRH